MDENGFSRRQRACLIRKGFEPSEWRLVTFYPHFFQIENKTTKQRKIIDFRRT